MGILLESVAMPSCRYLPNTGVELRSLACPALAGRFFTTEPPGKPLFASRSVLDLWAQSLQSCPTVCDSMDCSPPRSSVCGILQSGILEWVAMLSSRGFSRHRD